jgi:SAM-dependent methyltransferase
VLDVGCGSGYLLGCIHELIKGDGGKVVGVDHLAGLSPSFLSEAKLTAQSDRDFEYASAPDRTDGAVGE